MRLIAVFACTAVWMVCASGLAHAYPVGGFPPRGWDELHFAVRSCVPAKVMEAIEKGLDPNACSEDGLSPMHIATRCSPSRSVEILEILKTEGASKEKALKCGPNTPLHQAAKRDNIPALDWLLKNGFDVKVRGRDDSTVLHAAVCLRPSMPGVVEHLLKAGADKEARQNNKGPDFRYDNEIRNYTPLLKAANCRDVDAMRVLLDAGADLDARTNEGRSALIIVARNSRWGRTPDTDAMELLLEKGADPNAMDRRGETALSQILEGAEEKPGLLDLAQKLLEKGVDLKADTISKRYTYLGLCCARGKLNGVRWLLDAGADVKAPSLQKWRISPLHLAAQGGNVQVIDLLLARGAELDAVNLEGYTPLHRAAWYGESAAVRHLIAKGANLKARNKWGQTPLFSAVQGGDRETVAILARKKVGLNDAAEDGRKPIDVATEKGSKEIVKVLLRAGAKPHRPKKKFDLVEFQTEKRKTALRKRGKRVQARIVKVERKKNNKSLPSANFPCPRIVHVTFKTSKGKKALAEICYPFSPEQLKVLKPGASLDVVYLPSNLTQVGNFLISAEVFPVQFIEE
ncbi:MAG: ankyrin repeat domain-containing protein [Deltaproteobacteria bacterium]|nr:ankyrin repeat domain-containing protein [Deltaproteobacteria bacterium]